MTERPDQLLLLLPSFSLPLPRFELPDLLGDTGCLLCFLLLHPERLFRRDMGTCDVEFSATPDSTDRGQTTAAPAPETRDMTVNTIDEFSAVLRENKFVPAIFEAEFEEDEDDEAEF